jgi:hypothetical protein
MRCNGFPARPDIVCPRELERRKESKMDKQAAIDRILETENLTDGLEDDDAKWLLDWGIGFLPALIGELEDEDAAGAKVNELMAVMRQINQIVADRNATSPEDLADAVVALAEAHARAFGGNRPLKPEDPSKLAALLAAQPSRQAMLALIAAIQSTGRSNNP